MFSAIVKTAMLAGPGGTGLQPKLFKRLRQEECKFKACLGYKSIRSAWATWRDLVSKLKIKKKGGGGGGSGCGG